MKINILTLFPSMFEGFKSNSIIKRAIGKKIVDINVLNIRDFTKDKYGRVDTPCVGGGAGLIMKCQPIVDCLKSKCKNSFIILTSAKGKKYTQVDARELSKKKNITIICGHYEGIDERISRYVDTSYSIGDFILTGGEIPSMVITDSVVRLLEGAITKESLDKESFEENLLEYSQYTEPYNFKGNKVPEILYSGHHKAIEKFHRREQLVLTRKLRPDLFSKINLTKEDKKLLEEFDNKITPKWESEAIKKAKRFIKN